MDIIQLNAGNEIHDVLIVGLGSHRITGKDFWMVKNYRGIFFEDIGRRYTRYVTQ